MSKIYNFLTISVVGGYIIYLFYIKRLNFLIHERYIWFTLIAGILLLLIGLIGFLQNVTNKKNKFQFNLSFLVLLISILITFVPLRSLSSDSYDSRKSEKALRVSETEKNDIKQKINFNINTNEFTMYDWVKAKGLDDMAIFKDKEFTGTGFLSPKQGTVFSLSRFILSCCVVDATPAGILVDYDYYKEFKADDWLEVKGKFVIQEINGFKEPVVIPTSITKIKEPDNVYLNRN